MHVQQSCQRSCFNTPTVSVRQQSRSTVMFQCKGKAPQLYSNTNEIQQRRRGKRTVNTKIKHTDTSKFTLHTKPKPKHGYLKRNGYTKTKTWRTDRFLFCFSRSIYYIRVRQGTKQGSTAKSIKSVHVQQSCQRSCFNTPTVSVNGHVSMQRESATAKQ